MKFFLFLLLFLCLDKFLSAQYVYTIKADSVKITNCDSSELIIENHSQGVPGFLYNTGNGRTVFRRALIPINDSLYLLGTDTLNINKALYTLTADNGLQRTGNTFEFGNDINNPYGGPAYQTRPTFYYQNGQVFNWMTGGGGIPTFSINQYGTTENDVLSPYYLARFYNSQGGILMEGNVKVGAGPLAWISFKNDDPDAARYSFFGDSLTAQIQVGALTGSDSKVYNPFYFLAANDTSYPNGSTYNTPLKIFPTFPSGSGSIKIPTSLITRLAIEDGVPGFPNTFESQNYDNPYSRLVVNAQNYPFVFVNLHAVSPDTTNNKPLVINPSTGAVHYSSWSSGGSGASNGVILSSLAVNGTISAQKLKLRPTGWPDYVFAPGYSLRSLDEVEQYIKRNKHLPGIPSASDVGQQGVDVGDNQAAILKKIEELTLYDIEQEKKLLGQRKEMVIQERKLEEQDIKMAIQKKELKSLKREMAELKRMMAKSH